ncbi:cytochrome-c peroxidase [Tenacibaculum amylolyticum]|uniref:cytochrome-c peroxidase n=1 Tax=Tenacibaculum amylolyticum TaxID=104269 RepID=UPI0038950B88
MRRLFYSLFFVAFLYSCGTDTNDDYVPIENPDTGTDTAPTDQEIIGEILDINLDNLLNYANQSIPNYITKDNTQGNVITDIGATLGRVLFYDKNLSIDNTISCASCHQQENAFSDVAAFSEGVAGNTARHSMRLINARFAEEDNFFWDERAGTLEIQTTMPIQDHVEMGFSGTDGDPDFTNLIDKLGDLDYYKVLFRHVYGDETITENRIQNALAQFIRSIQSFDSKFDEGRALVNTDGANFPNFTAEENAGKNLFLRRPEFQADVINFNGQNYNASRRVSGGVGCAACHRPPEFDIDPNSRNNGFITGNTAAGVTIDIDVTRAPTLRDLVKTNGETNGGMMHDGSMAELQTIIAHYNFNPVAANNTNLDNRLRPGGAPQWLNMTDEEQQQLIAFLRTLSGTDVYTNEKWSDPFSE